MIKAFCARFWPKLSPEQAEILAQIKYPCC